MYFLCLCVFYYYIVTFYFYFSHIIVLICVILGEMICCYYAITTLKVNHGESVIYISIIIINEMCIIWRDNG